jgi:hypothetical protein
MGLRQYSTKRQQNPTVARMSESQKTTHFSTYPQREKGDVAKKTNK